MREELTVTSIFKHYAQILPVGILIFACITGPSGAGEKQVLPGMPMPINYKETADYRWLQKPVFDSRLLDDMEGVVNWRHGGQGEIMLTRERSKDGTASLRLRFPTSQFENRERGGAAGVTRVFDGEDWSEYNRISFYVYPNFPDYYTPSMVVTLRNEGTFRVPDKYGREGKNFVNLKPNQWNHIVWEIANLSRDKVTGVEFAHHLHNRERGAGAIATLDFDRLELQKVEADHYEGWNVAPGSIAFSHTGYQTGASKSAFASDLDTPVFSVIDASSGKTILTKPVTAIRTHLGSYQYMDFSEIREPGSYYIQAGKTVTRPFRIHTNVWRDTIIKVVNFFYCERCGFAIPGSHEACHGDLKSEHGDKSIIVNGGWHDAGDLSQGVVNTGEAVYAMLSLGERLKKSDPVLSERLIEEAKWGLAWILKGRYGDGFRHVWAGIGFWTDGIMGTADDRTLRALNSPWVNFIACASEALAGRVLAESAPIIARKSLAAAEEDFRFAVARIETIDIEITSGGALAAIDLYKATGKSEYADKAAEFGRVILDSQQRGFTGWDIPMAGFFYTGPEKRQILRYDHRSSGQAPLVALARMCEALPEHSDWIEWYAAIVLNTEYWKKIAEYTRPYYMLPNSVYRLDEMETSPVKSVYSGEFIPEKYLRYESEEPAYREQVRNGIKVADEYYLKLFPVFYGHRGNLGTVLSDAKALSAAAHVRGDFELVQLCQRQLEWVVGRNPFCQSMMYGEGYDYAAQYIPTSGDIVGSLPLGARTKRNADFPYWPASNCYNFKEVYVHPASRWLWLMEDLSGPAHVTGIANSQMKDNVVFKDAATGAETVATPQRPFGTFEATLPEGEYIMSYAGREKQLSLLPGEILSLDLRKYVRLEVLQETASDGAIIMTVAAEGDSPVTLAIRSQNLTLDRNSITVNPSPGKQDTITLKARMNSLNEPWVAVIIPDNRMNERVEAFSSINSF